MSSVKVSVIVPTNRVGGLDVLFAGLANQTMRSFELILVDNLKPRRAGLVEAMAFAHGVRCKHLAPMNGLCDAETRMPKQGQYQRALNTGIAHAEGEIVVILCDYTYLAKDSLAGHVQFQEKFPGESCIGTLKFVLQPALRGNFPRKYGWYAENHDPTSANRDATYGFWLDEANRLRLLEEWTREYEQDLSMGKLDAFMWSVYELPVVPMQDPEWWKVYHHEKISMPEGLQHHQACNLKNNSFLLEHLLLVNGMNEAMDGSHVSQDSELAGRLEAQLGVKFRLVHGVSGYFFDPHGIAIARRMVKPESHNQTLYSRALLSGFKGRVNDWSLREARAQILGEKK